MWSLGLGCEGEERMAESTAHAPRTARTAHLGHVGEHLEGEGPSQVLGPPLLLLCLPQSFCVEVPQNPVPMEAPA